MSAQAVMHCDETRRPVREKAEQAIDLFRRTFPGCDPSYLRVHILDQVALNLDGFADVDVIADTSVARGNFYAMGGA